MELLCRGKPWIKRNPNRMLLVAFSDDEEIRLKVTDKVLFAKYTGTEFKMDGRDYLLLESNELLAKVLN
ncbi:MAG TPA: hypothetical protein VLX61_16530 [Anaerolineales bacterium]|nr:hypothetical protein [Anaerolineales bacterium]